MKKKIIIILIIIVLIITLILGISLAWLTYRKEGTNQKIIMGDVYLTLEDESDSISLTDTYPMTKEEARERDDNTLSFSVKGVNTSNKILYYEILLNLGAEVNGKTRFSDHDLRFDLKLIDDNDVETLVVDAGTFQQINETLLYYDVLGANINTEIVRNYELRVWLSGDIKVSDTDPNADYPASGTNSFGNHYASVKIAVNGDFGRVIGRVTYNEDEAVYQDIYQDKQLIIASPNDSEGFLGWATQENGSVVYHIGDRVTINQDTTLYPVYKPTLQRKIMKLCNDSSVTYVEKYNTANGTPIDTPDGSGNADVCFYTSADSTNLAGQNSNVIFGDYCWQVVRTTANGGVKLVYNGEKSLDNKCLTTRSAGTGVVGTTGTQKTTISGSKIYGTGFEIFDDDGTNKFRLLNTNTYSWSDSTYQNIIGKYVCGTSSSPTGDSNTCTVLYYVGHYQSNTQASTEKYTIGSTTHYSRIGTSSYNAYYDSPALVGYMYGDVYNYQSKTNFTTSSNVITRTSMSSTTAYFYGDTATWNPNTNKYDLKVGGVTPTTTTTWSNIRSSVGGMYTCRNTTDTSCATVYYVVANVTGSYMYNVALSNNENINTKTVTWRYGEDFTKSGNDYVLTNPDTLTITLKDWYTNYSNASYKNIYVCSDFTSSTCSEMYYIGATSNYQITYNRSVNNYIFGNSVTYTNGEYIIDTNADTTKYQQIWDWYKKNNTISNSHYTCFKTDTNNCGSSIYYVYYTSSSTAYYIELKNGEKVADALDKMLNTTNSSMSTINRYNSAMKGIIDNWYKQNIDDNNLTSYLDSNAVFCNDRSISNLIGWNPTSGSTTTSLQFRLYNVPTKANASLSCTNITDRFSVENTKATLTYPVGLLSEVERAMMVSYYAKTGQSYWLLSPYAFSNDDAYGCGANASGVNDGNGVGFTFGARPAVVLKPDVEISGGSGTYDAPYIVNTTN